MWLKILKTLTRLSIAGSASVGFASAGSAARSRAVLSVVYVLSVLSVLFVLFWLALPAPLRWLRCAGFASGGCAAEKKSLFNTLVGTLVETLEGGFAPPCGSKF